MSYRYRRISAGEVTLAANCLIPRHLGAIEIVNRLFRVPVEHQSPSGKRRDGSEMTTQGCVQDGECTLEPIMVEVPPSPSDCTTPGCPGYEGDGMTSPTPSGGGVPTRTPQYKPKANPGDDVPPDTILPNCAHPELTPNTMDDAWCTGWVPTGEFLKRVQAAIDRMSHRGAACEELASKALLLLSRGTLRFTDIDYAGWEAGAPKDGDWAVFDRIWVDQWGTDGKSLDFVLSHEMDHSVGNVVDGITNEDGHLLLPDGSVDPFHTVHSRGCAGI
jgi:hypothetical protein